MFAILVPATLLPLIITLFWGESKAKRLGVIDEELAAEGVPKEALAFGTLLYFFFEKTNFNQVQTLF